ncbi:subtilisin-like protease SBT4.12 isoform X2 [Selaginella moellendorffii]|uniref:subtilisin-like protease SBT4.12 isoform X2 n=1 Tax=Selaginella moellendorffii TaxID=88036 RepID=UPI000D1C7095|nr:subtilisin-like protease SBT4.12 isoform X2 [Selaginella moellendorffii]|eukprot:XP_024522414.1 subtilisin-like protease SBT4.12 isoform X2 [Selaginella moellendorffii]
MALTAITAVPGLLFIILSILSSNKAAGIDDERQIYIVYLGGKGSRQSLELVQRHSKILASVTSREVESPEIVYSYKHGFDGFAARMTAKQAKAIAGKPSQKALLPDDSILLLGSGHNYRTAGRGQCVPEQNSAAAYNTVLEIPGDFFDGALVLQKQTWRGGRCHCWRAGHRYRVERRAWELIPLPASGIWPESASFSDDGMSSPPSRWKGFCNNTGVNSTQAVNCNNKIIGARFYNAESARDDEGHGSHTASTAGGSVVSNASMEGVASGTARGGLPSARLAVYKVCGSVGCFVSDILKAFDDAMNDGVDLLSLSLGGSPDSYDEDGIAIGAFHAIQHNITVVCSAGNSGPDESSVSNAAPWIVTVGASTIDRSISSDIYLRDGKTLRGTALSFQAQKKPPYSLVLGSSIPANKSIRASAASSCDPDSLNAKQVKNKIVVCQFDPNYASRRTIVTWLQQNKAAGAILINDFYADLASYFPLPTTIVKKAVGDQLLSYMNSTTTPVATLTPTVAETNNPAPVVAGFSSRGPNSIGQDIIKPDVTAPGVNILAAWSEIAPAYYENYDTAKPVYVKYNIISGTSMSCPHVTGALAMLKSAYPSWSPAALRSAIMTTATTQDDEKEGILDYDGSLSNPFGYGAGQIDPSRSLSPGLVYDTTPSDYVAYLCATGYSESKVRMITGSKNTTCSKKNSNLNYPSIAFPSLSGTQTTTRYLTSVDSSSSSSTYKVTVKTPSTLSVKVEPTTLTFSPGATLSFTVTVSSSSNGKSWQFGSIAWTDGRHTVSSPVAVKTKA